MGCKCQNAEEKVDELKSSQKNDLNNNLKPEKNQNVLKDQIIIINFIKNLI